MFNSAVVEVAIGLVFVFLLVSLLVSALTEIVASWLRWRATNAGSVRLTALFSGFYTPVHSSKAKAPGP